MKFKLVEDLDLEYINYYSRGWILPNGEIISTSNAPHYEKEHLVKDAESTIRYNFGYERYIGLPKTRLTEEQYNTLTQLLDYYFVDGNNVGERSRSLEINCDMNSKGDFTSVIYKPSDYTSDDIIKKIKRYYASGKLYESKLMEYGYWKPSKSARREFAQKMQEIDDFCAKNGISQSRSSDSYYFTINGQKYRVSNHTVATSNSHAYDWLGNKVRDEYHPDGEEDDTIYITAGKTRLIDIYNDLKAGHKLDRRGYRIQG